MADDFTGVPAAEWRDFQSQSRGTRTLVVMLWFVFLLLLIALTRKNVLASPFDLFGVTADG